MISVHYNRVTSNFELNQQFSYQNMTDPKHGSNRLNQIQQLRILDYRNAKYQGQTKGLKLLRDGIGMLLDHNYLYALGKWKDNKIDGPLFAVYPDNSLFFGFVSNLSIKGMCCYQVSKEYTIYSSIGNQSSDLFVLDLNSTKTLICLSINRELMDKLQEPEKCENDVLIQQSRRKDNNNKIGHYELKYENQEQKYNYIAQFLHKNEISNEEKNYKKFIQEYFVKKGGKGKISLIKSKDETTISYLNSSIQAKISDQKQESNKFAIKSFGFLNSFTNQMQICKTIHPILNNVEESNPNSTILYKLIPFERPVEAITKLQQYYKRSLQFISEFVDIDYVYKIKHIFHNIEKYISYYATNKYAQLLLQNSRAIEPSNDNFDINHHPDDKTYGKKQELNKIKSQIMRKASKRSKDKNYDRSFEKINSPPRIIEKKAMPYYKAQSPYQSPSKEKSAKKYTYITYESGSPEKKANTFEYSGKKAYHYLRDQPKITKEKSRRNSPKRVNFQEEPKVNTYQQNNYQLNQTKPNMSQKNLQIFKNSPPSKYAYLDKSNDTYQPKKENLRKLTEQFVMIEKQLKKQTPKGAKSKNYFANSNKYSGLNSKNPSHPSINASPLKKQSGVDYKNVAKTNKYKANEGTFNDKDISSAKKIYRYNEQ